MDKPAMKPNEEYLYSRIVALCDDLAAARTAIRGLSQALEYIKNEVGLNDYVDQDIFEKGHNLMDIALTEHADEIRKAQK